MKSRQSVEIFFEISIKTMAQIRDNKFRITFKKRRGFTVLESLMAVLVIGFVVSSVMVIMANSISSLADLKLRTEAFEIARDNLEQILASDNVTEVSDSGTSDINPEIEWETSIKADQASSTDATIWVKAKSSASYTDSKGELQTVEFEQWITSLNKTQAKQIQKLRNLQAQDEIKPETTPDEGSKDDSKTETSPDEGGKDDANSDDKNKPQMSDEQMWAIVMDYLNGKITYEELVKRLNW